MSTLLNHPTTEYQLKALIIGKPHAVTISGNKGSGKRTIAHALISGVTGQNPSANNPYLLEIVPENLSIGIESIRQIRDFLHRKTPGSNMLRRVILIQEAHTMTNEAQNALLKNLEEPPEDTIMLLTTDNITALKHTIRSRSQHLPVLPVDENSALQYFTKLGHEPSIVQTAYYVSHGRVGLLSSLLEESSDHELVVAIHEAKEFIKMDAYERIVQVESLSKHKERAMLLLSGLERVVSGGLHMAAQKDNKAVVKRFYALSMLIYETQAAVAKNANLKLVMSKLFLSM